MKKLIFILLSFVSIQAFSQRVPGYTRYFSKTQVTGIIHDSTNNIPWRDTIADPVVLGEVRIRPQDSLIYKAVCLACGEKWKPEPRIDSTRWVTTTLRRADSVFVVKGGLEYFAYIDSTGITTISTATDVDTTGIADGDVLVWDQVMEKWNAATPNYILNQNASAQTANFWIEGFGTATGFFLPQELGSGNGQFSNGMWYGSTDMTNISGYNGVNFWAEGTQQMSIANNGIEFYAPQYFRPDAMVAYTAGGYAIPVWNTTSHYIQYVPKDSLDNGYVHLTGNETISGNKTFADSILLPNYGGVYGTGASRIDMADGNTMIAGDYVMMYGIVQARDLPSHSSNGYDMVVKNKVSNNLELIPSTTLAPAGNFGNLQINRFGVLSTPGGDSLNFTANGLEVKHNIKSNGLFAQNGKFSLSSGGNYGSFDLLNSVNVSQFYMDASNSLFRMTNTSIAAPVPPDPAFGYLYHKASDHHLYWRNTSGDYDLTSSGMTNPMTTAWDLIIGGAGGAPSRFGIGTNNQVLGIQSGALAWVNGSPWNGSVSTGYIGSAAGAVSSTANVFTGSSPITWTLPTLSVNKNFYFKNSGTATLTISRNGTDVIDGATTSIDLAPDESMWIYGGTSSWYSLFKGNSSSSGTTNLYVTWPIKKVNDSTIAMNQADATHDGYLDSTDYARFDAKVSQQQLDDSTAALRADLAGGGGGLAESPEFSKQTYYLVPNPNITQMQAKGIGNNAFSGTVGTATSRTISNTDLLTSLPRLGYVTPGTVESERAGGRTNNVFRPDLGFDVVMRCSFPAVSSNRSVYMGMMTTTAGYAGYNQPSGNTNSIGVGVDSLDTNWQVMVNDGTGTATKYDTGIPVSTTVIYQIRITTTNGTSYDVVFKNSTGASFTQTVNTDLPDATGLLNLIFQNQNNKNNFTPISADFYGLYGETGIGF